MLWELINFFLQSFMIHTARAWELAQWVKNLSSAPVSKGELGSMSITLAPGAEKGECRVSLASQSSLAGASVSVRDSGKIRQRHPGDTCHRCLASTDLRHCIFYTFCWASFKIAVGEGTSQLASLGWV